MRFSILHTFQLISRTFRFLVDLDLAGDIDLMSPKIHAALSFDIR